MAKNAINPLRHLSVFEPGNFAKKRVDIIGVGATGSRVALSLAKLGVQNLHLWDFDTVEAHNVANQVFGLDDIGKPKVDALKAILQQNTHLEADAHNERVDGTQKLGEVVFLLTDTMDSRKQIWEKAIKYKLNVKVMIETRMGVDCGRVYIVNPMSPAAIKGWEESISHKVVEKSACGSSISIGPTADVLSGMAVWQFMKWFKNSQGKEEGPLESEIVYALRPMTLMAREFKL